MGKRLFWVRRRRQRVMHRRALFTSSLLAVSSRAFAQSKESLTFSPGTSGIISDTALNDLQFAGNAVADKYKGTMPDDLGYRTGTQAIALANRLRGVSVSAPFSFTVRHDTSLLQKAVDLGDPESARMYLQFATDDMTPKMSYLASLVTASLDPDGEIPVVLDTQHRKRPVIGLQVKLFMRGAPDNPMPVTIFREPTTPTHGRAPPGFYVARLYRPDTSASLLLEKEVLVDGNGEEIHLSIEIP